MKPQDLSALISIRDFAIRVFDNINFKMNPDEVKQLRHKIVLLDKVILEHVLKFDPINESYTEKNEDTK